MSINEQFSPMLLLTVNNSIGDESMHLKIDDLIELFNKKLNQYTSLDKYAVDTIQTEADEVEIKNFAKKYSIPPENVDYVLSTNPY